MKKVCKYCKGTGILTKRMYDKRVHDEFKKAEDRFKVDGQVQSVWLPMIKMPIRGKMTIFCDQCDARVKAVKG